MMAVFYIGCGLSLAAAAAGAELRRAGDRVVRAWRVRIDLSSCRHRHRGRGRDQSRAHARVQRGLRQYRRGARRRYHRHAHRLDRLARRVPGAGRDLRHRRTGLSGTGAGGPPRRQEPQHRSRRAAVDVAHGFGAWSFRPDPDGRGSRFQYHDDRTAQGDRRSHQPRHVTGRGGRDRDARVPVRSGRAIHCRPYPGKVFTASRVRVRRADAIRRHRLGGLCNRLCAAGGAGLRDGLRLRPGDGERFCHRPLHRRCLACPRLRGALFHHLPGVGGGHIHDRPSAQPRRVRSCARRDRNHRSWVS